MKLSNGYIMSIGLVSLIISCTGLRILENEPLENLNNEVYKKLIAEHNDNYKGGHNSFFIRLVGNRRSKLIYEILSIANTFNATFRDTIGKFSESLPYEYLIEKENLFLMNDKKSVLTKELIEVLRNRKLIDSTLYNYGRKGSTGIELTESDILYFNGKPIKRYNLDETLKSYFYSVDTLKNPIKIKFLSR